MGALVWVLSLLFVLLPAEAAWSAGANRTSMITLPGCPEHCGNGVRIPYPFGIGAANCSLNKRFNLTCEGNRPYLSGQWRGIELRKIVRFNYRYEITGISIEDGTMRVLKEAPRMCPAASETTSDSWNDRSIVYGFPKNFALSGVRNRLTAIGCSALAATVGANRSYTFGCLSTCGTGTSAPPNGSCSGFGCCQTTIPAWQRYLRTTFLRVNRATIPWLDDGTAVGGGGDRSCGYSFLVETANYTFNESHLLWQDNRIFPVVLDWFMISGSCEEVQGNAKIYTCKSSNSLCNNIRSDSGDAFVGYTCSCSTGYQGNPYLVDGCQDIDECQDPSLCSGTCINTPGSYQCISKTYRNQGVVIGLSIGIAALILIFGVALLYKRIQHRRLKQIKENFFRQNYDMLMLQQQLVSPNGNDNVIDKVKFFSLKDIEKATNKFDGSRIIGQGGHGVVYKGLMELSVVAIKKPKLTIQEEICGILNEVILLSQISHKNVVQLIGCCLETEVPLLVYEFISNGTLSDHIHKWHRESPFSWDDRLRIATEISAGLAYLHTAANISVLHRDIKSSNILLDDRFTAKVSDFGASRTIDIDQTHVSTNIQGTFGYLDPEYMHTGQLSNKSDVYSLGVILVELLTGQKPHSRVQSHDERNLITHFCLSLKENQLFHVLDDFVLDDVDKREVELVADLAMRCLSMRGKDRPTMKDIEMTLESLMKRRKGDKNKSKDQLVFKHARNENVIHDMTFPTSEARSSNYENSQFNSIEECIIPLKTFYR